LCASKVLGGNGVGSTSEVDNIVIIGVSKGGGD